jgi:hypothetical protein
MKRAFVLAVAALLVVAVAAGAADAAQKVFFKRPFGGSVYKPKRIEFHDATLSHIHWRHYNTKRARGHAKARVNTCDPFCAAGKIVHGTANLKLFKRHTEGSRRFYGCLVGKVHADDGKTYPIEWPPACNH